MPPESKPFVHPEQQTDEIYMGNTHSHNTAPTSTWQTIRLGMKPLKSDGTPYTGGGLRPWFVQRQEVQRKLAAELRSENPWEARVRALEQLLANGRIAL